LLGFNNYFGIVPDPVVSFTGQLNFNLLISLVYDEFGQNLNQIDLPGRNE